MINYYRYTETEIDRLVRLINVTHAHDGRAKITVRCYRVASLAPVRARRAMIPFADGMIS